MVLGDVNLIYGKNEQGKTSIVEFLLTSLFKKTDIKTRKWGGGGGQVIVSGIESGKLTLSTTSREKLEDKFIYEKVGAPLDFSRLCIVKAAEVNIAQEVDGGVDKKTVQNYLSDQKLLNEIFKKISPTIQSAEIIDGDIIGNHKAEISKRDELKNNIVKIMNLMEDVKENYSQSEKVRLEEEKNRLEQIIKEQEIAKGILAGSLSKEINYLKKRANLFPRESIQQLHDNIHSFIEGNESLIKKIKSLDQNKFKSKDYTWLKHAEEVYSKIIEQKTGKPNTFWSILGGVLILTGMASMFYGQIWITLGLIVAGVILFGVYVFLQNKREKSLYKNIEIEKLAQEFRDRTGKNLSDLAVLKAVRESIESDYHRINLLQSDIDDLERKKEEYIRSIQSTFSELTRGEVKEEKYTETLNQIKAEREKLDEKIANTERELAALNVNESNFIFNRVGKCDYDRNVIEKSQSRLHEIEKQIDKMEQRLVDLKQEVCNSVRKSISCTWEELIDDLNREFEQKITAEKSITAEIIAKMVIKVVINDLREEQDDTLRRNFADILMIKPLRTITGDLYKGLDIEGEDIMVSDGIHNYTLDQLSTGTKEQVLLAMRIGFISKILKGNSFFLILDDAFQYSDWQRREWLLDEMFELAKLGWQIIYFTMDDNIRDLFQSKAAQKKEVNFSFKEISSLEK